jgi:hypothetical protein
MSWPGAGCTCHSRPAPSKKVARPQRVVEPERLRLVVEERERARLLRPGIHQGRLARGDRHAAAVGADERGVASHVIGVAVRVDEASERLPLEALRAGDQREALVAMRDVARIDEHVVPGGAKYDLVGVQHAADDHADRWRQGVSAHGM